MKEVGAVLNMTTRTVAFHKYRMMERLGVTTTADLVRFAVESNSSLPEVRMTCTQASRDFAQHADATRSRRRTASGCVYGDSHARVQD